MSFFDDMLNSDATDEAAKLQQEVAKLRKSTFVKDERYWTPEVGKDGTGFAIIRFLPATEAGAPPFVRLFSHSFKGPSGLFYIKNSPQTLGLPCPASEMYFETKKIDDEAAKRLSRKVNYISNIFVINHPLRPEDNGKVFLYKYGIKIFDKINLLMNPKEPGLVAFSPFHMTAGANFRLRVKTKAKQFPNYDDSVFDPPSPLNTDRDALRQVFENEYNLAAEVAPDKFEGYDTLKKRLSEVMGLSNPVDHDDEETPPWVDNSPSISPAQSTSVHVGKQATGPGEAEDLAFFQKLQGLASGDTAS